MKDEDLVDITGPEYSYIPDAYGTINSSAKVTKHVSRVKLANPAGLKWNDEFLVNHLHEFNLSVNCFI